MSGHEGHRHRIIEKLDSGGLCEHEILEILLFNAIPRLNTNDLAHRLLEAFGSIPRIFSAPVSRLKSVEGVGENVAAYLCCIGKFFETYYAGREDTYPKTFEERTFLAYVEERYAPAENEVLDFYLLDKAKNIFFCKRFSSGELRRVVIRPEQLTRLILENKPDGLIAVHNHPNGNCFPSETDDKTTGQCEMICSIHNVKFYDHFIYSPAGTYSYYCSGKMKEIHQKYSVGAILGKGEGVK